MKAPSLTSSSTSPTWLAAIWIAATIALMFSPGIARAKTCTWTGGSSTSGAWNHIANWSAGALPGTGDDVVFPLTASRRANTNGFTKLRLNSITFSGAGYEIHGNAVTLSGGLDCTAAGSVNTIELGIALGASQAFDCSSSTAALHLNTDVNLGSYTLTMMGPGAVRITGVISGAGGLTKTGTGTHWLQGSSANTYTGPTLVGQGTLMLAKPGGHSVEYGSLTVGNGVGSADTAIVRELGNYQIGTIPITINEDGWLDLDAYNDTVGTIAFHGGRASTTTGTLILGGDVTVEDHDASITGRLSLGSGTRVFDVTSFGIHVWPSPHFYLDADVSGAAKLVKNGTGVMLLGGDNTYAGTTTLNAGQILVDSSTALGSTTGGTTVEAGASMWLGPFISSPNIDVSGEPLQLAGALGAGNGHFGSSHSWSGAVTLGGMAGLSVNPGDRLDVSGPISGSGGFTKTGMGILTLSGTSANTFTGDTIVNKGTLWLSKLGGNAIQYGSLTIGDGSGTNDSVMVREADDYQIGTIPVAINEDGWLDLGDAYDTVGDITLHGGRISSSSSGTLALGGDVSVPLAGSYISGNLSLGSALRTFDVLQSGGVIIGNAHLGVDADVSGSGGMVKTGDGAMSLSGNNTFGGTVTVEEGKLLPRTSSAFGSTMAGTVVQAGAGVWLYPPPFSLAVHIGNEPLLLQGRLFAAGSRGTNEWAGPITLDGVATVSAGTDCLLNLPGAIDGSGSMIKDRRGSLILSGSDANTYSGDTYVNEGVLELAKSAAGGGAIEGSLFIGDGIGGADADVVRLIVGGQIDSDARVTIADSGLFDLDDRPAAVGSLVGSGHVSLGSGDLAAGMDDSSTIFSGVIDGSGDLEKWGFGTFTLDGSNTYSGTTRVGAGTLLINGWQPSSDVYVWEPGRLGGIGTVGAIDCIGAVAPGASAGQLSCSGAKLSSGLGHSTFEVELDGYPPAEYDRLDAGGTVTISGSELEVTWGFVPAVGDTFTIIDNDGVDPVVGVFNGLPENGSLTAGNVTLYITYAGGDGNDVVLGATEVVPLEKLRFRSIDCACGAGLLQWSGGVPFYQVSKKVDLGTNSTWQPVGAPTRDFQIGVPMDTDEGYYRVIGGR